MTSTSVCRLCRASTVPTSRVHLFSLIGIKHKWSSRITAVLDIAVQDDDRISSYMCSKCTSRLIRLEDAIDDLDAFKKLAQSSLHAKVYRTWILVQLTSFLCTVII